MPMPTLDERIAALTITLELAIYQQRDHDRVFQEPQKPSGRADAIHQLTTPGGAGRREHSFVGLHYRGSRTSATAFKASCGSDTSALDGFLIRLEPHTAWDRCRIQHVRSPGRCWPGQILALVEIRESANRCRLNGSRYQQNWGISQWLLDSGFYLRTARHDGVGPVW
jgi:hypothetical protein